MHNGPVTTATVLFCDLVGSTAQRTSLGDDVADRLAVTLDELLRGAISSWRGSIVKSTGDGLMAVFAAASDALSAAIAIQKLSDHHNRTAPAGQHLVLRIGISAGDVHFVANDCHGTPVVEAARLESAAEPRTIYVGALCGSSRGAVAAMHFEPVGLLELKGLPQPVETFRVPWQPVDEEVLPPAPVDAAPAPTTQLPLPGRLAVRPASGVIGYEAELRAMTGRARARRRGRRARDPARVRRGRTRQEHHRRRGGTPGARGRRLCASSGTARRTSRRRTGCSPRHSGRG